MGLLKSYLCQRELLAFLRSVSDSLVMSRYDKQVAEKVLFPDI